MDLLHIGSNQNGTPFYIPRDSVTQTFAILAKRGVGKTFTAAVMVEEMLEHDLQVVVCDPLDVWYGLRSSFDGKSAGHKILVIGGEHGDIPLTVKSGILIADFLVENNVSAVLCTRHFSKTEQRNFYADFLERLYHRKGEVQYRTPLHLVVDEADELAPQRLFPGTERVFGALDTIVRRGRASGIGVTMISQRSAALNKDCLTQIEVLIALRTISPQDRKALEAWIDAHHDDEQRQKKFLDSLSSLPIGTAWFWSPGWLDCFSCVSVRRRKTFDSSSTPKVGDKVVAPKKLASVDLELLKAKMAETIERAKADDPAVLKQRIRDLEAQLKKSAPKDVEGLKKAFEDGRRDGVKKVEADKSEARAAISIAQKSLEKALDALKETQLPIKHYDPYTIDDFAMKRLNASTQSGVFIASGRSVDVPAPPHDKNIGKCERAILTVLAQQRKPCTKSKIALLSNYSVKSSSFANALSALRVAKYIENSVDRIAITDAGEAALGRYDPLPAGIELREKYINELPLCEGKILNYLFTCWPESVSKQDIANATGYSSTSSAFANSLSALRVRELITGKPDIKAADDLMG